jgi:hypothetical protein
MAFLLHYMLMLTQDTCMNKDLKADLITEQSYVIRARSQSSVNSCKIPVSGPKNHVKTLIGLVKKKDERVLLPIKFLNPAPK